MSILNYLHTAPWFLPVRIILSIAYGFITSARNLFFNLGIFKIHRVGTPIISVGNITVGGSGKTILVQSIIEYFIAHKKRPAVLSRGYGRTSRGLFLVADENSILGTSLSAGDEAFIIAQNFPGIPVVVSEDRVMGAKYLGKSFSPDVIILDDGFQHRRLYRDLDVLLLDTPANFHNHMLPWGRLRESPRNIGRADQIIYSKNGLRANAFENLTLSLDVCVYDQNGNQLMLENLSGNYGMFAGLGNPECFFDSLQQIHGPTEIQIVLPDHAQYNESQLNLIRSNSCDYWITTQKDYFKLDAGFIKEHTVYYIKVSGTLPGALRGQLKQNFN
ncbi:tetraacyldisaccharide 4'-kinase [bacterium]|nr:tetraacyldisaccharide 4'-kinase [bacterium]